MNTVMAIIFHIRALGLVLVFVAAPVYAQENSRFSDVQLLEVLVENADISGNVTKGIAAREELARRGHREPDKVVPLLIEALSLPPSHDRKIAAGRIAMIGVLQDIGPPAEAAVPVLRVIVDDPRERNDWVKMQARMALDRIGTPKAKKAVTESRTAELRRWAQGASVEEMRRAVVQNAYLIRRQLRAAEPGEEMIGAALDVLEVAGDAAKREFPTFGRLAADARLSRDLRQRATTLSGLSPSATKESGYGDLYEELAREIDADEPLVASLAMEELARLGPSNEAMALLVSALEKGIEPGEAARLLGEYGPRAREAVPLLLARINDAASQANILQALGRIGGEDDRVSAAVVAVLNDRDGPNRGLAADAAGILRLDQAVPSLIDALTDRRKYTRIFAAKALGRVGEDRGAVSALGNMVEDPDDDVRLAAVEALAALGALSRPVVPIIAQQLEGGHSKIKEAASRALARIGGPDAEAALARWTERHADADRKRYFALRRGDDQGALQGFLRQLPTGRQLTVAREMIKDDDILTAYMGAGLMVRAGREEEAIPVLVRIVAMGGNAPDGPLRGRMGYDWVHDDDPELAKRLIEGMIAHAKSIAEGLPNDQRNRLDAFIKSFER